MVIDKVLVRDLVSDPANARRHGKKNLVQIAASLKRFGQQKPIVVDDKMNVVAGNGFLAAAIELGWTHVETVRTGLPMIEARAYAIADNRTSELAEWDDDVLAATIKALDAEGIPASDIGFDDEELRKLMGLDILPAPNEQSQLDQKNPTICPECGHEWTL